ncbi:MAG: hypothetical protein KAI77_08690, partial [Gammaproteobacteria bacterium]|nr:hypothetical protein [Gammaproteobacteria bacterium]
MSEIIMCNKSTLLFILIISWSSVSLAQSEDRITILYDAFGKPSNMVKDWGISALIEFNGQR